MAEPAFRKPPPEGDGTRRRSRSASGGASCSARADRLRRRGGHRGQRPDLHRQHRRGALPQRPLKNKVERSCSPTRGRRAGEHPHPRLRQAGRRRIRGRPRPLRHDDAAAPRPGQRRDRADVDPARPEGRNPRLRDRKVQRSVHLRRAEADPADGQGTDRAADQPRRQRRLPRLRPRRLRDRLRLRRHRPPLLPLEHRRPGRRTVRRNQRPARLSADVREEGAGVRALPPYRHRPGSRRPPAGLPRAARQRVPISDLARTCSERAS